jgi:hypothetical protein
MRFKPSRGGLYSFGARGPLLMGKPQSGVPCLHQIQNRQLNRQMRLYISYGKRTELVV